jgi:uncharacterized protein (TIGR03435 family)
MPLLADFLGSAVVALDRPVVDKTGLDGRYNFSLTWKTDDVPPASNREEPQRPAAPGKDAIASRPSLFDAIQEQLGLKLDARTGSIYMLVIDHAEKVPTAN